MIVYVRLRTLEGVLRNQNLGRGKFGLKTRTVSGLLNTQWSLYGEGTAAPRRLSAQLSREVQEVTNSTSRGNKQLERIS